VKTVVIGGKIVAKVSIIVPIFNASDYLGRCVESLLKQTMKSLEIILVNDGSTDDSLQICHFYAKDDKRIRVIDKPNGGVSKVPPIVKTQIQYLSEGSL
jgi:glycosyltransferase involved in cell wall biosynthesis